MIVAMIVLVPLLIGGVYFYVRSHPKVETSRAQPLLIFDGLVLLGILMSCAFLVSHFQRTTGQSVDRAWWPVLAFFSCLFVATSILFIAGVFRNKVFWRNVGK